MGILLRQAALHPIDFSITKNVTFIMIVFLIMLIMFTRMAKSYKKNALAKWYGQAVRANSPLYKRRYCYS